MRHNLNLNWLRSFEAAARLLSFTGAGLEIGLTQTAVSQHIKALEARLAGMEAKRPAKKKSAKKKSARKKTKKKTSRKAAKKKQ